MKFTQEIKHRADCPVLSGAKTLCKCPSVQIVERDETILTAEQEEEYLRGIR